MKYSGKGFAIVSVAMSVTIALVSVLAIDRVLGYIRPQYGIVFPPDAELTYDTTEFRCVANINAIGIRGGEVAAEKSHGVRRVLAIGDSFTFGWGVQVEQAWPKRLESHLRVAAVSAEVFNAGEPGADSTEYARIASKAIPIIKPDLVIVGVLEGDDLQQLERLPNPPSRFPYCKARRIERCAAEVCRRATEKLFPNLVGLFSQHKNISRVWKNQAASSLIAFSPEERRSFNRLDAPIRDDFIAGKLNPSLICLAVRMPDYFVRNIDASNPNTRKLIRALARDLAAIKAVARRHSARVLVLSIPNGVFVNVASRRSRAALGFIVPPWLGTTKQQDQAIEDAATSAGIPSINFTNAFRRQRNADLFFPLDGHMNVAGNDLLAELMTAEVAQALQSH